LGTQRWSKRLALGIHEIDREHEEIHRLIVLLQDALRTGSRDVVQRQIVQTVLSEVLQFAQRHFAYEERLMKKVSYPEYDEHKNEHKYFLQQIRGLKGRLQTGESSITSETMNALSNWVHHHVLGTDTKYVPYLFSSSAAMKEVQRDNGTIRCGVGGQSRGIQVVNPGNRSR
jgi:hemerythrin